VGKFKLDNRKAIEAVAILAGESPGRKISRKRLLALLYLASRECLKKSGRPLLGGRLVAMKYGPIHGDLYDLINERKGTEGLAEWSRHFHNEDYHVALDVDPGLNAISRFEKRLLIETLKKHENDDDWDVADQTHKLSEYTSTYSKKGARTIKLEQLIYAVHLTAMERSILRDLEEQEGLDNLFASVKNP
jgi:uncharacterized phage-associated protein